MFHDIDLQVPIGLMADAEALRLAVAQRSGLGADLKHFSILRRSIDARGRNIRLNLRVRAFATIDSDSKQHPNHVQRTYTDVHGRPEVVIIGTGPCGLFAALRMLELGLRPLVFDRGKDVRSRRRDLAAINRLHTVDPDSN